MAAGSRPANQNDILGLRDELALVQAFDQGRIDNAEAPLVIVDEAYLSIAKTRKEIIERYPEPVIIGITATPARGDGRGLGELYQDIVIGPTYPPSDG
jgi:superfamily II DNA or RNA helicase